MRNARLGGRAHLIYVDAQRVGEGKCHGLGLTGRRRAPTSQTDTNGKLRRIGSRDMLPVLSVIPLICKSIRSTETT